MKTHYYVAKLNKCIDAFGGYKMYVHFLKYKQGVLLKLCRKKWSEGTVHWNFHMFPSQISDIYGKTIATCNRPYMSLENYLRTGYGEKSIYYEIS